MEFEFFFQIALILLSTKLAGDLSVRLGQPSVLGKLIVGIVIGPAVLGWVENSELLTQLSNVGVILLMFMAGLETDLEELNANRNSSLAVALRYHSSIRRWLRFRSCDGNGTRKRCILRITSMCDKC